MSRRKLTNTITNDVLSIEIIKTIDYKYDKLSRLTSLDSISMLQYSAELGIIRNTFICEKCEASMFLTANKRVIDKFFWFCNRCKNGKSIRNASFFEGLKKPLFFYFKFFYCWAKEDFLGDISYELEVNKNTAGHLAFLLRERIEEYIFSEQVQLGGINEEGESIIVEIDESVFFRRKFNRGRFREHIWVLGLLERGSKKVVLIPIPDRSASTLHPLIEQYVLPGSTIITDCWAAYGRLGQNEFFTHLTVNHSINFLNPDDSNVHTQNIENLWLHAKKKIRKMFGTNSNLLAGYLFEFCFRKRFEKRKMFNNLLLMIRRLI